MKKLTFLVAALFATMMANATSVTLTMKDIAATKGEKDGVSFVAAQSGGVTAPAYNRTANDLRLYAKNTITIAYTENIKSISFNLSVQGCSRLASLTANTGTCIVKGDPYFTAVWSGDANTVTIIVGDSASYGTASSAKAGQLCFDSFTVSTEDDAGKIDTLTVTVAEALEVLYAPISGAVSPNYYILSGTVSNLDLDTDYGSASFTLSDATGDIYVYRAYNLNNEKFTATSRLADGDDVKVLGRLQKYVKNGTTTSKLVSGYLLEHTHTNKAAFYVYQSNGTTVEFSTLDVDSILFVRPIGTENGHDWVDLGLPSGLKWATCNVGAERPESYGDYYAWGETTTKDNYEWYTYKYGDYYDDGLTKYCNNSSYGRDGFTDELTTLEAADDVATANWGGKWRMPTIDEWQELHSECTWTLTGFGYKVKGPNGNFIFLPAAGGYYWSSSLYTDNPRYAQCAFFRSDDVYSTVDDRCYGLSVRPVCQ